MGAKRLAGVEGGTGHVSVRGGMEHTSAERGTEHVGVRGGKESRMGPGGKRHLLPGGLCGKGPETRDFYCYARGLLLLASVSNVLIFCLI